MIGPQRRGDGVVNASTRGSTSQTSAHASSCSHDAPPRDMRPRQSVGVPTADSQFLYRWSRPRGGVDTAYWRTSFSRMSELVAFWSIDARTRRGSTQCSSVRTGGVRRMRTRCIMPTTVRGGHIGDASLSRPTRCPRRAATSRLGAVVNTRMNRYTADSVQQASTTIVFSTQREQWRTSTTEPPGHRCSPVAAGERARRKRCWSEVVKTHTTGGSCHGYCAGYRA
jgi:hypothetical protein